MDLVTSSSLILGNICEGCLSVGRKLAPIYGDESKGFHCILEAVDNVSHTILLCWECTAILQRTLRFREQVKQARDCLVGYMLNQSTLTPLSNLRITNNDTTTHITHSYKTEDVIEEQTETADVKSVRKRERRNERKDLQNDNTRESPIQPVAFIKVEERDDYYDDVVYADDNVTEDAIDDRDLKAVLKSDAYEAPVKKRNKRKVAEDNFDDSDDEPLKKKAEGKSKKKKEKAAKSPRGKREKPAGVVNNARVAKMLQRLNVPSGQIEMVVLSWEEIEEERAKALVSEAFTRHEYRCYDCVIGFNHRMKLDDHMKKHDPSAGDCVCSVCLVRCKHAHALSAHRRRHRVRWRCCTCGALWSRAAVAADHAARRHHAPPPEHCCPVCGHVETTLGKLRNHLKNHAERQKCELCGKSFRDRSSLRTHLFIHRGEKEYACSQCDKRFLFKKALEVHLITHDAPQHLYCHQCDMNFKNRMSFYQHMKYNLKHIDPAKLKHACPLCSKRFAKASRLREHHLALHLRHAPVRCPQPGCSFACSSRPVLRTHVRMLHRNARALRNHVCHRCGKTYCSKKTLEGHLRSHTGERPFRCAACPAAFGYHAALYNHNKLVHRAQPTRNRAAATTECPPWMPAADPAATTQSADMPAHITSDVT